MVMTGRDWIIYILSNGLEDEPLYEDGKLLGFMTAIDAAIKFNVGLSTIQVWFDSGLLNGIKIGNDIFIPSNTLSPMERKTDEKNITNVNGVSINGNHVYIGSKWSN